MPLQAGHTQSLGSLDSECPPQEQKILDLVQQYQNQLSETNKFEIAPGITLNFNQSLAERPITIVVKKNILLQYADYHTVVK